MSSNFENDLSAAVESKNLLLIEKYLQVYAVLQNTVKCDPALIEKASHVTVEKIVRINVEENVLTSEVTSTPNKSKKSKRARIDDDEKLEKDDNDWVCAICNQLGSHDNSSLLLCDGECLRSFHTGKCCIINIPLMH